MIKSFLKIGWHPMWWYYGKICFWRIILNRSVSSSFNLLFVLISSFQVCKCYRRIFSCSLSKKFLLHNVRDLLGLAKSSVWTTVWHFWERWRKWYINRNFNLQFSCCRITSAEADYTVHKIYSIKVSCLYCKISSLR